MCGICGIVGPGAEREESSVRAMARTLSHRGPDAEGSHVAAGVALGNRRLEIIDLERGRQPLSNEDRSVWITFNGEIYNYKELREELERTGHRFRTATDTEVVVHLYEEHGERCVDRLRGMFAFAIWDAPRRTLFAARDRFGQKPFFYSRLGDRLAFASEVKALLALPELPVEPELAAIDYFLSFRCIPPPLTMFRGISKLPAAHWLRWRDGELTIGSYWSPDYRDQEGRSEAEWIEGLRVRLREAVRYHLVSDVPVGALLSGGLDSGIIVALMAELMDERFPTFTLGSSSPTFDERPFARDVVRSLGTDHRERQVGRELLRSVPRIVWHLDEPTDPIAACFYASAGLASEGVKVALGGDGGDEMFAGFDRFAAFRLVGWYGRLPRWLREEVVRPAVERMPTSFRYKNTAEKARWLVQAGSERSLAGRYARMNSYFRFGPESRDALYGDAMREELRAQSAEEAVARPFREAPARDLLHRMIYADLVTRFPEHTLMLTDRLGMAHGLEIRAPLLDDRLAEFTARMPREMKIRGRETKYALRAVARDYLPPAIVRRPKHGFQFPIAEWFDTSTLSRLRDSLASGPLVDREWVRPDSLDTLFGEHRERRADHHVRIWMLWTLDLWCRIYLEGRAHSDLDGLSVPAPRHGPAARREDALEPEKSERPSRVRERVG